MRVEREAWGGVAAVFTLVVVFHLFSYWRISHHYAAHLPHYDSIGGYTFAFGLLGLIKQGAYDVAFSRALGLALSQTQALFTFLFSPILAPTPQHLQLYNTLCFAALAFSLYRVARTLGASAARSAAVASLPLLPDTFAWWVGGLLDWQRDPSFACLLGAAFFLSFAHAVNPRWTSGLAAGALTGIALLGRDSSPVFVMSAIAPIYLGWCFTAWRARRVREQLPWMALPVVAAAPLAVHYVIFQLLPAASRFGNAFVAFALGGSPLESAASLWSTPFKLFFGVFGSVDAQMFPPGLAAGTGTEGFWRVIARLLPVQPSSFTATAALNGAIAVAVASVIVAGAVACWRTSPSSRRQQYIALAAAGLLPAVLTEGFLFGIGLRPLSFGMSKHPFYPTLLAFLAIVTAAVLSLPRFRMGARGKWVIVVSIHVVMLTVLMARIDLRTWPPPKFDQDAFAELVRLTTTPAPSGRMKTIAFLWHEGLTLDVIAFNTAKQGHEIPRKLRFKGPQGELLDPEIGVPAGVDRDALWKRFEAAVLACSDLIVVADDPRQYSLPRHPLVLYQAGGAFVEGLLGKPEDQLLRVRFNDVTLVAIRNQPTGDGGCY